MFPRITALPEKPTRRPIVELARRLADPARRNQLLQWIVVGAVGIGLGLATIGTVSLPERLAPLLLAAVLFPFAAMIGGGVRKLLLAIIILDVPFHVDIHLGFRESIANLGGLGGLDVSVTLIALIVLYGLWAIERLTNAAPQSRPVPRITRPGLLFLGFSILSLLVARDSMLSIFDIFVVFQIFLVYVYVASSVRTPEDVRFVVAVMLISLVLQSLVIIWLALTGHDFTIGPITTRLDAGTYVPGQAYRIGGTIGSPNNAAAFLVLLLAPAFSVLFTPGDRPLKLLAVASFGLGVAALVFTFSRGGWLAFALPMVVLVLLAWQRGWIRVSLPVAMPVGVVGAVALVAASNIFLTRLFGNDQGAALSRVPLIEIAFRMIRDHPLLGVGANNYVLVMPQYLTPDLSGVWVYTVHNKYLLIWAEIGIGGLVAFIALVVTGVRRGWEVFQRNDRFLSPLALGFTAALVGHMGHMMVEAFYSRPIGQLLWLIAGLMTAMVAMKREN